MLKRYISFFYLYLTDNEYIFQSNTIEKSLFFSILKKLNKNQMVLKKIFLPNLYSSSISLYVHLSHSQILVLKEQV